MGDVILTSPSGARFARHVGGGGRGSLFDQIGFCWSAGRDAWSSQSVDHRPRPPLKWRLPFVDVGFHYIIDLHANARSGFIKRALRNNGTLDLTVDKKSIEKILLVRFGWDRLRGEHVVERYLKHPYSIW